MRDLRVHLVAAGAAVVVGVGGVAVLGDAPSRPPAPPLASSAAPPVPVDPPALRIVVTPLPRTLAQAPPPPSVAPVPTSEQSAEPRSSRARATPQPIPVTSVTPEPQEGVWDRLAQCESGGNWSINTGNGYYGGLQFSLQSWRAVGGSGYPHENSRSEQIKRGELLRAEQGWGAWPACSKKLGLR